MRRQGGKSQGDSHGNPSLCLCILLLHSPRPHHCHACIHSAVQQCADKLRPGDTVRQARSHKAGRPRCRLHDLPLVEAGDGKPVAAQHKLAINQLHKAVGQGRVWVLGSLTQLRTGWGKLAQARSGSMPDWSWH